MSELFQTNNVNNVNNCIEKNIPEDNLEDFFGLCCDDDLDDICSDTCNRNKKKNNSQQRGKKQIYENIKMYNPQGDLIGRIPIRKRDWYIKKGLCTVIDEDAIKLNFEPEYEKSKIVIDENVCVAKENICVICGTETNLKKFRVVPYELKKLFPTNFKAHKSSDVVIACEEDAAYGDMINRDFKLELFEQYGIDINNFKIDSKDKSVYNTLIKVINDGFKFKNQYTTKMLEDFFGNIPSETEIMEFVKQIDNFNYNGFKTPEEMLIDKITREGNLSEFVQKWKENFVFNMNPEFLQWDYWSNDQ